ncbi:tRNA (adenosine(37)-N6)-threonylcarbamoyltransferase complex transferase subunit TsaD [Candidatus Parcubacteria bacterium]|nr:MAG: tRNA (adenosine(37)-N6)-threonylcarbamoyltransferase complex transferase subunit TsaD [Candidatus Parcubacteria bacterium]
MNILAIETSCDETSVAVVNAINGKFTILSNIVSSQIKIHRKYGGIVPEVAARNHAKNIIPVFEKAIKKAQAGKTKIDYIAVANKPGLITSLLVGVETAKAVSYVWQKPLLAVDHVKAHLYANWFSSAADYQMSVVRFPSLGLIVSGGHTQLIYMKDAFSFKIVGETLDDAAGEAFDKVAKILGLGYPGGPVISRMADFGDENKFQFPLGLLHSGDFNFSFSGIKTSVLYLTKRLDKRIIERQRADICAGFQKAVVDVLVKKTYAASKKFKTETILLGGGVTANRKLREEMQKKSLAENIKVLIPPVGLCTDNAAIIAAAAYFKVRKKQFSHWSKIKVESN